MASKNVTEWNRRQNALAALGKAMSQLDELNLSAKEYGVAAKAMLDAIKIIREAA
jgi:hypothetical protein